MAYSRGLSIFEVLSEALMERGIIDGPRFLTGLHKINQNGVDIIAYYRPDASLGFDDAGIAFGRTHWINSRRFRKIFTKKIWTSSS